MNKNQSYDDGIKRKFDEERDLRLHYRPEGTAQFTSDFSCELSKYAIDPSGADVGGTWYWNRNPGVACDVVSYDYLPLFDEMDYVPKDHYAKGPEILAHCRRSPKSTTYTNSPCFKPLSRPRCGMKTNRYGTSKPIAAII